LIAVLATTKSRVEVCIETEHVPLPKLAVQSPQPSPGQDTAAGVDGSGSLTFLAMFGADDNREDQEIIRGVER